MTTGETAIFCNYCGHPADLVADIEVRPARRDVGASWIYRCLDCDAWVNCQPGTMVPLGALARRPLQDARIRAEELFQAALRSSHMSQREGRLWLARELAIDQRKCRIEEFDEIVCQLVCELCAKGPSDEYLRENPPGRLP